MRRSPAYSPSRRVPYDRVSPGAGPRSGTCFGTPAGPSHVLLTRRCPMNNDLPPDALPDDRGDERIGALLRVPPLDDGSRQRLVARALDGAPRSHRRDRRGARRSRRTPLTAAAAVLVALLIGAGVLALVNRDGTGSR